MKACNCHMVASLFFSPLPGAAAVFRIVCLVSLPLSLLASALPAAGQEPANHLNEIMNDALRSWHVPGAALAIVKEGKLIYSKGFGIRELGKNDPVTDNTIFPVASCTKSFTTLAMGMLVDDGKLAWDDPVRKHIDFFHLADPLADANVTLRDLVSHRTGVGRHELLWYRAPWGFEERLRKIGKVKPEHSFRSGLEYQSILFGAAGYAAGKASGTTWEELVRRRILVPLGMKDTSFTTPPALKAADHASPHMKKNDKIEVIPWYAITEPDPAGSINSNARDLSRFLRFQLGDGRWRGKRLISAGSLHEPQSPQVIVPLKGYARIMNPATFQLSYGMGWVIQDYRGQHLLMHGGAINGFRIHFTLVPEANLGFVLLNNLHETQMNLAVSNMLVDWFLGLPYKDWNAYFLEIERQGEDARQAEMAKFWAKRRKDTKPSLPLSAYTGTYTEPAYGQARVTLEGDTLVWHWSTFHWRLKHYHYDQFVAEGDGLFDLFMFQVGPDGEVKLARALRQTFRRLSAEKSRTEK
jgi:CubicO group peptidase (beta-lactamase class C family)